MGQTKGQSGYGAGQGESFERYYLRNVLSEGCNCAELVITETAARRHARDGGVLGACLLRLFGGRRRRSRPDGSSPQ